MQIIVTLPDGKGQVGVEIIEQETDWKAFAQSYLDNTLPPIEEVLAHDGPRVNVNYRETEYDVWMPVDTVEVKLSRRP